MAEIVVLSADDNETFAYIIPRWLRNEPTIHHAIHLPSAAAMTEFIALMRPNVVVMDLHMPGPDPIEEMHKALKEIPQVRFIVMISDTDDADRVIDSGAAAVVNKDAGGDALISAILSVAQPPSPPAPPPARQRSFPELRVKLPDSDVRPRGTTVAGLPSVPGTGA